MRELKDVVIAIATFRRPHLLAKLLQECSGQMRSAPFRTRLLVVDNDPAGTAREVCDRLDGVLYHHEPRPGIAAARNRALDELPAEADALIFIDDDEIPGEGWLATLVDFAETERADVVSGPVLPIFDEHVPAWIERGGFWRRSDQPRASHLGNVATNNTLVRVTYWRGSDVRFSEELSMKGGSDTEFFRQLRARRAGVALWSPGAVVHEWVLPERARPRWLFRRAVRIGNINARYASRPWAVAGGVARVAVGAPLVAFDWLRNRQPMARSFNMLGHGVGMLGHAVAKDVVEYRRKA